MKNIKACFSSNSDEWRTPLWIYDFYVNKLNCIDLFPSGSKVNQFDIEYKNQNLFCNPPFSIISKAVDYCINQYLNGCNVYLLIPSRTDTKYFHKLLLYQPVIFFVKGRLSYNDTGKKAPFPSLLVKLSHYNSYPLYSVLNDLINDF